MVTRNQCVVYEYQWVRTSKAFVSWITVIQLTKAFAAKTFWTNLQLLCCPTRKPAHVPIGIPARSHESLRITLHECRHVFMHIVIIRIHLVCIALCLYTAGRRSASGVLNGMKWPSVHSLVHSRMLQHPVSISKCSFGTDEAHRARNGLQICT